MRYYENVDDNINARTKFTTTNSFNDVVRLVASICHLRVLSLQRDGTDPPHRWFAELPHWIDMPKIMLWNFTWPVSDSVSVGDMVTQCRSVAGSNVGGHSPLGAHPKNVTFGKDVGKSAQTV